VWDIREDPRRFEHLYNVTLAHNLGNIADINGRSDQSMETEDFATTILQDMVVRSHYALVLWDQLDCLMKKIQALFNATPQGVMVEAPTAAELIEVIQCLPFLFEKLSLTVKTEVGWYKANPGLRSQFMRLPTGNIGISMSHENDEVKQNLCVCLAKICGGLEDLPTDTNRTLFHTHYHVDVLETFLRLPKNPEARNYISDAFNEGIAKLYILGEVSLQFTRQS